MARLAIPKDRTTGDLGSIIPTELHLVHYTHLTDKHAALVGEKLSDLKKRMAEKKEIDGGYTTIVVFNYLEPRVKDTESEKSEETL